jgi:hypothetical protein
MSELVVTTFQVSTDTNDAGTIYNNGNMQYKALLTLQVLNQDDNTNHALTDEEIASAAIFPYEADPEVPLPDGWGYSQIENEYNHHVKTAKVSNELRQVDTTEIMPEIIKAGQEEDSSKSAEAQKAIPKQTITLWVTCKGRVEALKMAGSIMIGGETYTTNYGTFDSSVVITAVQSNVYTGANIMFDKIPAGSPPPGPQEGWDIYYLYIGISDGTKILRHTKYNYNDDSTQYFYSLPLRPEVMPPGGFSLYAGVPIDVPLKFFDYEKKELVIFDPPEREGQLAGILCACGRGIFANYFSDFLDIKIIEEYGNEFRFFIRPSDGEDGTPYSEGAGSMWLATSP